MLGVQEDPTNDRIRHYYARELYFKGRYKESIEQFKIHLSLPSAQWKEERSASYKYIAKCFRLMGEVGPEAHLEAFRAILEWPHTREPFVELAQMSYLLRDWKTCFWAAGKALEITHYIATHMVESDNWGYLPHDLYSIAAWNLGFKELSLEHAVIALNYNPEDERLQSNVKVITDLINTT